MPKKAFEFHFKNPVGGSGEELTDVLFINDAPAESDVLRLEARPEPTVIITLKPVADKVVSDKNYHFKLTFKPDALALPEGISLDATHADLWDFACIPTTVAAAGTEEERAPGDVVLYFLYKGDAALEVKTDSPVSLTLRKVGARSNGGTRPTLAQLSLNRRETDVDKDKFVVLGPGDPDYNLEEYTGLGLLAPRGQAAPTLMAGFVSSDIILNDGSSENYLRLRIVNTGLLPISLASGESPSRFTLSFDADDDPALLWALGTISQVSSILIPGKPDSTATDPTWPGHAAWTVTPHVNRKTWTLTPKAVKTSLAPGEAIEVPISKIVTGHATGRTALRIGYSGLPGHGDGELAAFIQKYPLVFAGQNVGVGTGSPSDKLTVETAANSYGITHTDGTVKLTTRVDNLGAALGTSSEHDLRFFTGGSINNLTLKTGGKVGIGTAEPSGTLTVQTRDLVGQSPGITHTNVAGLVTTTLSTRLGPLGAGLGTQSNHPLRFFTNNSDPQMTLTTAGKVGIGTTSPSEMLTVQTGDGLGITHTNGTVKLSTGIDSTGAALGTEGNHDLRFFNNGSVKMWLKADGKVGIGTDSPSEKLTVKTTSNAFGITHTDGTVKLFTWVGGTTAVLGTFGQHHLYFQTENKNRMSVTAEGKVGIGTTSPSATLDVHGDFMIKGKKPIEYQSYTVNADNPTINTGYSNADWIAVLSGFSAYGNNDTGEVEGVHVWPRVEGGIWKIWCDLTDNRESTWYVSAIFIRRELVK